MSDAFTALRNFIQQKMRMAHVYQPVMLEALFAQGGHASTREVAAAILAHDESQIDYYEQIVKNMPGKVLRSHGIVERTAEGYTLAAHLASLSEGEREALIEMCRAAVAAFKAQRGSDIWEHRRPGLGIVPGRVRYDTLKRAGFRCELCGISADERALDVDHIIPRAVGGTDDNDNLQALCWLCNTNKGAGDDSDLRDVKESYSTRETGCPFCEIGERKVVAENQLAFLIEDAFPVTKGHLLAIPRRHVGDFFDLRQPERNALHRLVEEGRAMQLKAEPTVAGFNVGVNAGAAAGQTVFHCHLHLIPRRAGDVENPRGGVRGVVPDRQDYGVRRNEQSTSKSVEEGCPLDCRFSTLGGRVGRPFQARPWCSSPSSGSAPRVIHPTAAYDFMLRSCTKTHYEGRKGSNRMEMR